MRVEKLVKKFEKFKEIVAYLKDSQLKNSELLKSNWDYTQEFKDFAELHGTNHIKFKYVLSEAKVISLKGDGVRLGDYLLENKMNNQSLDTSIS